jgi:hypothetical protein
LADGAWRMDIWSDQINLGLEIEPRIQTQVLPFDDASLPKVVNDK